MRLRLKILLFWGTLFIVNSEDIINQLMIVLRVVRRVLLRNKQLTKLRRDVANESRESMQYFINMYMVIYPVEVDMNGMLLNLLKGAKGSFDPA